MEKKNGDGKEESIWRMKIYFLSRKRKTKKENIWTRKIYIFAEKKEKEEIIWRRNVNGEADKQTYRPTGQI